MVEWLQTHLDIDHRTASDLVLAGRRIGHHRYLSFRLADGHATFPRTIAALKYAETGATRDEVVASFDRDLDGVARLTATRRRVTPKDEQDTFEGRFFTMQPTLDESSYRMWGQLPGIMGRTLEKALDQRGDELPHLPDQRDSETENVSTLPGHGTTGEHHVPSTSGRKGRACRGRSALTVPLTAVRRPVSLTVRRARTRLAPFGKRETLRWLNWCLASVARTAS